MGAGHQELVDLVGLRGADDIHQFEFSLHQGRIIVTHDADFRDLPLRDFKVICHAP